METLSAYGRPYVPELVFTGKIHLQNNGEE